MIGAREHYAPPLSLHQLGVLDRLYTDVWWHHGRSIVSRIPGPAKRLAGRFHPDLPSEKVVSFNAAGLAELALYEYFKRASFVRRGDFFAAEGERFARRVALHLKATGAHRAPGVFMGFKTAALETFQALSGAPLVKVLVQFDAGAEHFAILAAEHAKWPGWGPTPPVASERLMRRWADEWRLADVVFVNSEWTKRAIAKQGVPAEKIAVGPLAFETPIVGPAAARSPHNGPLRVLWVGGVTLGKGIQYLIEAANRLDPSRFEFTVVGAIGITRKGLDAAPANMHFTGLVPREETARYYREADVYVLPTLSDNWPITQLEAMAHGLPVIITSSCGSAVDDGINGRLIPPADSAALQSALEAFERSRDEITIMGKAAVATASQFDIENYARKLVTGVEISYCSNSRARNSTLC